MKTIVAVYDELNDAYQAIEELRDAGIDRSNVSLVTGDPGREYAPYFQETGGERDEPVEGALAGGAIGGIAGFLLGLGALAIPGIGPVVAAGPLVSGLIGVGIGAAGGGLLGALVKAGVPEEEAGYYLEGVRQGGTLVAVRVMSYQVNDVIEIMERNNPIDLDQRVETWQEAGWTGFDADAESSTRDSLRPTSEEQERERLPTGDPHAPVEYAEDDRYERVFRQQWEEVTASLEDEEALSNRQFNEIDDERPRFRTHYDQTYASRGYDYAHYAPAYRFGYLLADDMRYQDRPWDDIEPVVRERWQRDHIGDRPWEEVKDAIRHAWEEAQKIEAP